jgi:hypothetical protein
MRIDKRIGGRRLAGMSTSRSLLAPESISKALIPTFQRAQRRRGGQRLHHPAPGRLHKRPMSRSALAVGGAVAHQRRVRQPRIERRQRIGRIKTKGVQRC